jgi:hypothetical protein
MTLRAKFKCDTITKSKDCEVIGLSAVSADCAENKQWSQYTPCGSLSLTITNPGAFGTLAPGEEYFLTIEAAK